MKQFLVRFGPAIFPMLFLAVALAPLASAQNENSPPTRVTLPPPVRVEDSALLRSAGIDPSTLDAAHRMILSDLSEASLGALLAGGDPKDIRSLSGKTVEELIRASSLGDVNEELVYTPLLPCRVIDTRNAGGYFGAWETRHYNLIGLNNYSVYGGFNGSCNIPTDYISTGLFLRGNRVRALAVNVIALYTQGSGWMRAWPTNQSMPFASIINYGNAMNIANGITLQTCNASCNFSSSPGCNPCPSGDLSIIVEGAASHVVVDVVGYFVPANVSSLAGISSEGVRSTALQLPDSTCRQVTSCSITNSSTVSKGVTVIAAARARIDHVLNTHDELSATVSDTSAFCASWTDPYAGKYDVHSLHPSGCCMEGTIPVTKRFVLGAGLTGTYYLNARMELGSGPGALIPFDEVTAATIQCIFEP